MGRIDDILNSTRPEARDDGTFQSPVGLGEGDMTSGSSQLDRPNAQFLSRPPERAIGFDGECRDKPAPADPNAKARIVGDLGAPPVYTGPADGGTGEMTP